MEDNGKLLWEWRSKVMALLPTSVAEESLVDGEAGADGLEAYAAGTEIQVSSAPCESSDTCPSRLTIALTSLLRQSTRCFRRTSSPLGIDERFWMGRGTSSVCLKVRSLPLLLLFEGWP